MGRLQKLALDPPGEQLRMELRQIKSRQLQLNQIVKAFRENRKGTSGAAENNTELRIADIHRESAALRAQSEAAECKLGREAGQELRLKHMGLTVTPVIAADIAVALLVSSVCPVINVLGVQPAVDHTHVTYSDSLADDPAAKRMHIVRNQIGRALRETYCAGSTRSRPHLRCDFGHLIDPDVLHRVGVGGQGAESYGTNRGIVEDTATICSVCACAGGLIGCARRCGWVYCRTCYENIDRNIGAPWAPLAPLVTCAPKLFFTFLQVRTWRAATPIGQYCSTLANIAAPWPVAAR